MDGEASGINSRRVAREIEKTSTFSNQKGGALSKGFKWWFYTIATSESCPSSCNDPHTLMWKKTLPQVLELQEWCEMRDASIAAAHKDAEVKNNKP